MVRGGDSYYGLLQAFADALKLLLKEYVAPTQSNIILFFLGPVITLIFSLLGLSVIPHFSFLLATDINLYFYYFPSVETRVLSILQFFNLMLLISYMLSECRQLSGEIYDVLLFLSPYTKWLYLQDCSIFSSFIPIILPSMLKPYSLYNNNLNLKMTDCEFNQWFAGFTDGEANFAIVISNNIISFKYSVKLHIDHLNTLKFIKSRLGCGNIIINSKSNSASFELNRIGDIQTKLITRLDKFSLNGIKFLDYLTFKEGISIKLDESISKSEKFERIAELKNSMNNKRTNLAMPITHEVNITPY